MVQGAQAALMLFHGSVSLLLETHSHTVSTKHCPLFMIENSPCFEACNQREALASSVYPTVSQNVIVFVSIQHFYQ